MARPRKQGMDWFPCETVFNESFRALEELHGNDGFTWLIKLWQNAYRNDSGCVDLTDIRGVIAAKTSRISCDKQSEIISDCIKLGLLMQKEDGTYTSDGISKRHLSICKKRENDRNLHKNELSQRKHSDNVAKTPQIRLRLDKDIDKSKIIIIPDSLNFPDFISVWESWKTFRKQLKKPLTDKSIEAQLKQLATDGKDIAIKKIEQSIANGWQGLFDIKNNGGNNGTGKRFVGEFERNAAEKYKDL